MIDAIERTLELDAPLDRVWKAISEPKELVAWFPDEVVDLDVRPGAEGWWRWDSHGKFAVRFEVVEPPRRLVWTWARKPETPLEDGPRTRVEWSLQSRPDGGTTLHLRESGFLRPEDREANVTGWEHELAELLEHLGAVEVVVEP